MFLMKCQENAPFLKHMVTGDEKWIRHIEHITYSGMANQQNERRKQTFGRSFSFFRILYATLNYIFYLYT